MYWFSVEGGKFGEVAVVAKLKQEVGGCDSTTVRYNSSTGTSGIFLFQLFPQVYIQCFMGIAAGPQGSRSPERVMLMLRQCCIELLKCPYIWEKHNLKELPSFSLLTLYVLL